MTEQKPAVVTIPPVKEAPAKTQPQRQLGGPQSGLPPPFIVGCELAPYLIVGIDFGSNFCRVSTFFNGVAYGLQPYEYRALVEDLLRIPVAQHQLVHSLKYCVSYGYAVKYGDYVTSTTELVASFLRGIKERIERDAERMLAKAVISVPSYFTHAQRSSLIKAATEADIAVLGLINEPTAAALDVCFRQNLRNGRYLVISSGTYSFEASIIHVQNGLLEVKAVRGNRALSGHGVSCMLREGLEEHFSLTGELERLHSQCDAAKPKLDNGETVAIDIGDRFVNIDCALADKLLTNYRSSVQLLLKSLLHETCTDKNDVAEIILTGESTRSWLLAEVLREILPKPLRFRANVSAGAATYAALLVRQAKDWVIWDCLANPVIVAQGEHVRGAIAEDSPLPISGHAELTPDKEGKVTASVLQTRKDSDNDVVPVALVKVVEELPPGESVASVDLTVTATADGTFSFSARHKALDVNLTVEVTEPEGEQPIIDLSPPKPVESTSVESAPAGSAIESAEGPFTGLYHPGLTVKKYGQRWFVDSVIEGSSAAEVGINVYDELLWIDKTHVFHLNDNVPAALHGTHLGPIDLTLIHAGKTYKAKVARGSLARNTAEELKYAIASASIEGRTSTLIDALLNYAQKVQEQDFSSASKQSESSEGGPGISLQPPQDIARKAIERALELCEASPSAHDIFRLRALRQSCALSIKTTPDKALRIDTTISKIERTCCDILKLLDSLPTLPPSAVKNLFELAVQLDASRGLFNFRVTSRLVKDALTIASHYHIPPLVWKYPVLKIIYSFPTRTDTEQANVGGKRPILPESDLRESVWAAEYADSLLEPLLKSTEFTTLRNALASLGEEFASACLPSPALTTENAFSLALSYQLHGDWWLHREAQQKPPDETELEPQLQICQDWNIVPCESSAQAYEFSRCILVRLAAICAEDPKRIVICQSMLASAYAGLGSSKHATVATSQLHELIQQDPTLIHIAITTQGICTVFLKAKRYDELEAYCTDQLLSLNPAHEYDREQMGHALIFLARKFSICEDFAHVHSVYARLHVLFANDGPRSFDYSVKYAEFLFRIEDNSAEAFLVHTQKLGRQVGAINDETAEAWANNLRSMRGKRNFE